MRQAKQGRGEDGADADRQTASLAALAATLLILVLCLGLVRALRDSAAVEDCVLAGRTNCGPALLLH